MPVAIAGLSLGYLFMQRSSASSQPRYQTYGQPESTTGYAQERAGQMTSQAQERAGQMAGQARYQARRVEDRFQQMLQENPLAVGAVAFALGAAIGLTVPATRKEHELMGEARDSLMQQAKSSAQDTLQRAQRVAEEAQSAAKQEAQAQDLSY
jgi:hypothetical protein